MPTHYSNILLLFMLIWFCAIESEAHELGAPFSSAIPEPIILHHAHVEDEQKLNFVGLKDFRRNGKKVTAFSGSLELAMTWGDDFRLGSEIFIPFSNTGTSRNIGLGDIEIQTGIHINRFGFGENANTLLPGFQL